MVKKHIYAYFKFDSNTNNKLSSALQSSDQASCRSVSSDMNSLVVFLLRFIGLKPKDNKKYGEEDEAKGEQIQSCLYNYSRPKFIKICSIPEFRIIFNCIYSFHLESVFNEDLTLSNCNNKEYLEAFKNTHKILQRNASMR